MGKQKAGKIPYQEYQKLKELNAKRKFKLSFYPPIVLTAILIPAAIFILGMLWYFANAKKFLD